MLSRNQFILKLAIIILLLTIAEHNIYSQGASPANWLYPEGNAQSTKRVAQRSEMQDIDSMQVKLISNEIYGDVIPLIGNVIDNPPLFSGFNYGPNEIVAVIGGELVVLDAAGRVYKRPDLINPNYIKSVSSLIDTLANNVPNLTSRPVVIGLETTEHSTADTMAYGYLAAFDRNQNNTKIIRRLALNMRRYAEDGNIFASVKPVFGRLNGTNFQVYATVNSLKPTADDLDFNEVSSPFFRGLTQFDIDIRSPHFPLPDGKDDILNRVHLGPEVGFAQPSIANVDGLNSILLPTYGTPGMNGSIRNFVNTSNTFIDSPYLLSYNMANTNLREIEMPIPMSSRFPGSRPRVRNYYIDLEISDLPSQKYVLVTEEYLGIEGSNGISRLHIYNSPTDTRFFDPLTLISDPLNPPFSGGQNHIWSIAVGNVDGNASNEWLPYYPNSRGNEIIVSQSSREFAYPDNKIMVLRYSDDEIEKPTPAGDILFPFDTLCTHRMSGWIAAVNDLDGAADGKEEIIVVDGSKVLVLRLRDYSSFDFQMGHPFDTVYIRDFPFETISSVAVADIEGDGLNDLIVTTYQATYIIGTPLKNILEVIEPRRTLYPPSQYCGTDTMTVAWKNIINERGTISIYFQELDITPVDTSAGILEPIVLPIGDRISIADSIANNADTVSYRFIPNIELWGKIGVFVVESDLSSAVASSSYPIEILPILSIFDTSLTNRLLYRRSGDTLALFGVASCYDSLSLEWSYDLEEWYPAKIDLINQSPIFSPLLGNNTVLNQFWLQTEVPCVDFFTCSGKDIDSLISYRIILYNDTLVFENQPVDVRVLPNVFPLEIDTTDLACPSKHFSWDINDFEFQCDNVSFSYSIDGGLSYIFIETVPANSGKYQWNVPVNISDDAIIRICCEESCIRTDTVLQRLAVRYIDMIAPNPFSPFTDGLLQIIYQVPTNTNVTIRIFDQNNVMIAEPTRNLSRTQGIAYCDYWDGLMSDGTPVANGMYYILWETSNGIKEMYPVFIRK